MTQNNSSLNLNYNNSKNINYQGNAVANNNASDKETVKTLDTLFRKTNTKPNIYYLPLNEEEVNFFKIIYHIILGFGKKEKVKNDLIPT